MSTTHRLLASLQRDGFVRSDGDSRRYSLGLRMFELGQRVSLGSRTITGRARFRAEIEAVRERGHAISDEEHECGIRAVGVPVTGPEGAALAALSTPAPAYRMSVERLTDFVPCLREAAAELAVRLPRP